MGFQAVLATLLADTAAQMMALVHRNRSGGGGWIELVAELMNLDLDGELLCLDYCENIRDSFRTLKGTFECILLILFYSFQTYCLTVLKYHTSF